MGKCALLRGSVAIAGLLCLGLDWPSLQEWRYDRAQIRKEKLRYVQAVSLTILRNKTRYTTVQNATGVPWYVIGSLHSLECSSNFNQHLHNGDSIHYKTRHVPKGRPPGPGPWTWETSAIDALKYDELPQKNWRDIGHTLLNCELYNGPFYLKRGLISPYLHSYDTLYVRGKIVADGIYSSTAVSQQCGVVPILKTLLKK